MDSELVSLEDKIGQAVQLCQRLRSENNELRQQLASASSDNKKLAEKVEDARTRLETILKQIPE